MEFFGRKTHIDFVRHRKIAYVCSVTMLIVSVAAFAIRGLNYGIDFTGGTLVEVGYPQQVELPAVRSLLEANGFAGALVQHLGSSRELLIRVPPAREAEAATLSDRILEVLRSMPGAQPDLRRVEFLGPQVGQELVEAGGLAILLSLGGILIYIWLRFERRLALGAVAATMHDPLAILGFFAVTGMEFDLIVLAAILAVIGYSVNDTIVVFDRIRDNIRKMRTASPTEVVNVSVNETLSRTLITSGTTQLVVIALLVTGGPPLHGFSTALFLGILVGTYSSIYVAAATALDLGLNRGDMLPVAKEGAVQDERP